MSEISDKDILKWIEEKGSSFFVFKALNEKGVQSIFVGTSKLSGCGNSIQEAVIQAMEKEKAIG
jgi:hypothetical protein